MNYKIIAFVFFLSLINIFPCTTAVVSGRATVDGKPLLLKNRDADALQNRLVFYDEGEIKFIGLVNSEDKLNKEVWTGFNSFGFGIMNSASYNLKGDDTTSLADQEGVVMKLALSQCKSIDDFEDLLKNYPKPIGVEANFGVIDAFGGAAYFEVNNYEYIKYDVNDPAVAPNGYLIRTNYSAAGDENKGYGYIRYATAFKLFEDKINSGKIDFNFLINDVPRCLAHSFTNTELQIDLPENEKEERYVFFRDYIPRYFTSAAIVIQGADKLQDAKYSTMWSIVGFPLTSVVIPVWLLSDGTLPDILVGDATGNAPLCDLALTLKDKVFSDQYDATENYLNLSALMNKKNTGVRQKLIPLENEILGRSEAVIADFKKGLFDEEKIKSFYDWIDEYTLRRIKSTFSIK